jgi:hypothetical protein
MISSLIRVIHFGISVQDWRRKKRSVRANKWEKLMEKCRNKAVDRNA